MDLRGHGSSPVPPADRELTLERLVADVAELTDHLDCANAHIVRSSAGGDFGQKLAMNHAERVRSLMLFGPHAGAEEQSGPSWIPQIATLASARLHEPMRHAI
jgi:pimeloyl-ACP methyl ester carboxylesterase